MDITNLNTLVTVILAISLASERLVTIIKNIFPFLAGEVVDTATTEDGAGKPWYKTFNWGEWIRRIAVLGIAFLAGWFTAPFLGDDQNKILIGGKKIDEAMIGLLASGGSTFWSGILGYTKAVKDIKIQQRANLRYTGSSAARGATKNLDGFDKFIN